MAALCYCLPQYATANHLHYISLPNDPLYSSYSPPNIFTALGTEESLIEWVIVSGTSDPTYYEHDGTRVTYKDRSGSVSDTLSVFDYSFFDDITNPQLTAFEGSCKKNQVNGLSNQRGHVDAQLCSEIL